MYIYIYIYYILPLLALETWFVWGIDMCYPAKIIRVHSCPPLPNFSLFVISIRCSIYSHDISFVDAMSWLFGITSQIFPLHYWLVVWNIFCFPIYWEYMGTLIWLIFFRGVGQPPTRLHFPYIIFPLDAMRCPFFHRETRMVISHSYWKWPIEIVDLPNWKMVIFQFANCKRLPVML